MINNYVAYHLHTELSLLDSCTNFKLYVDKAVELGQKAIAFTEHGNIFSWIEKKMYCDKKGIKYIHGAEFYLTEDIQEKVRDNYHTILLAKNYDGIKEINRLIDLSTQADHFYYKPRITFNEFLNISDNVFKISACLASPLNKARHSKLYEALCRKYDFYEVQSHNSDEQKQYNIYLSRLSEVYGVPLIAGTDTHSIDTYKAECRSILQKAKKIEYADEDKYDLAYKSYPELVQKFNEQGVLSEAVIISALDNTNVLAGMVEDFKLDLAFKYPKLYADEERVLKEVINRKYKEKLAKGIIQSNPVYIQKIQEEFRVLKKIGMLGFILFMSELCSWCRENDIPYGYCRGSVGGSVIAFLADIIDLDPIVWNTVFSRFANEDRKEIGDIDIDFCPSQRALVYNHIINKFGQDNTAYILAVGTISDKGTIDEIGRALGYDLKLVEEIKNGFDTCPLETREKYPELFYYFSGLLNTAVSQSMHPAGIVISPVNLPSEYGTFWNDGKRILSINMEEIHEVSLVKYDILGLKNIEIIKETCELIGKPYPLSCQIDWSDQKVWSDLISSPVGVFQFEGDYAFDLLKRYRPTMINHMSIVNAALRPSGTSYRDKLIAKEKNKNPSEQIDELLKDNDGYLIFQEDTIKFLTDVCGLTGSEADNIRRAIGRKDAERLQKALPGILEGYCNKSAKPREIAEEEAKAFLKIIEDSSAYQFGYNHSTGYSMIGYTCAYYRYYYPLQFISAYINNALNEQDVTAGVTLASMKGIKTNSIKFRYSKAKYFPDIESNTIYQGLANVKYLNDRIAYELYSLRENSYPTFIDLLYDVKDKTSCDSRQIQILISLDFFIEFGNNQKLLSVYDKFEQLHKRKTIKLSEIDSVGVSREVIETNSKALNANAELKQFTILDMSSILKEYDKTVPNTALGLIEQLKSESDYLGFCHTNYDCNDSYYFVTEINTKYSPVLKLYNLRNGSTRKIKAYKKDVYYRGTLLINQYDIIEIGKTEMRNKKRLVNGEWKDLDELEEILVGYSIIKQCPVPANQAE